MYNDDNQRKSDEEYMRSLYERFRKEVDEGRAIEYYELNELLDIYDFAQDEGDLLVQFFVFLTASRLFPDNHEFDERMAFFLSYISSDAANEMINRQGRIDTPLWDILKMGVKCYPSGDPEPFIIDIINKYDKLDCESTLKIIDLLREMSEHELLAKYYPELSKRAEDKKGFAFEVAETLKDVSITRQQARDVAEELTTLEPFNIEAWLLLARLEFALLHPSEALSAVDYALAIDPNYTNAHLTRGVILVGIEGKEQEAINELAPILQSDPHDLFALQGIAQAYAILGKKEEAADIYASILQQKLTPTQPINPLYEIIRLEPSNLEEHIRMVVELGDVSESEWQARMFPFLDEGRISLVARVMDTVYKTKGLTEQLPFFIKVLYADKQFDRLIEVVVEYLKGKVGQAPGASDPLEITDYLILASAYLRSGRREEAAQLADAIASRPGIGTDIDSVIKHRGIILTANFIRSMADAKSSDIDLSEIDPLSADYRSAESPGLND